MEKIFQVEVVDFDGIAVDVEVMAYTAAEAEEIALSMVENADYANVHFADGLYWR